MGKRHSYNFRVWLAAKWGLDILPNDEGHAWGIVSSGLHVGKSYRSQ